MQRCGERGDAGALVVMCPSGGGVIMLNIEISARLLHGQAHQTYSRLMGA